MKGDTRAKQLAVVRRRHRGYVWLLLSLSLVLLLQPLAYQLPLINPAGAIGISLVMLFTLHRHSAYQPRRRAFFVLGMVTVLTEVMWVVLLGLYPSIARHLSVPHLLIWVLFIGVFLLRMIRGLMREPYVTVEVVMGAASGYLLIGYLGGFLLHTTELWQPDGFDPQLFPKGVSDSTDPLRTAPALMLASLSCLTAVTVPVSGPGKLLSLTSGLAITLVGQLYMAVLIALILGRFHRRGIR